MLIFFSENNLTSLKITSKTKTTMKQNMEKNTRNHSKTLPSNQNTNTSYIPLIIWFFEVITVITVCCVIIRLSFIPWLPTYTLYNLTHLNRDSATELGIKINQNSTIMFTLVITNPNEGKSVIHGDSKVTLYKDGFVLGVGTILGFYQGQNSNHSSRVLVNVDQKRVSRGEESEGNGIVVVGVETRVRYRILGWTTKEHLLKLEASLRVRGDGRLLIGEDVVQLQPLKTKL